MYTENNEYVNAIEKIGFKTIGWPFIHLQMMKP